MQVTGGAAAAIGTATGLAIAAPIAVIDPNTRRNFHDKVGEVGRTIQDVGEVTGGAISAPVGPVASPSR